MRFCFVTNRIRWPERAWARDTINFRTHFRAARKDFAVIHSECADARLPVKSDRVRPAEGPKHALRQLQVSKPGLVRFAAQGSRGVLVRGCLLTAQNRSMHFTLRAGTRLVFNRRVLPYRMTKRDEPKRLSNGLLYRQSDHRSTAVCRRTVQNARKFQRKRIQTAVEPRR